MVTILGLVKAFILGFREAGSDLGMTYDDDPESSRSVAYDHGRNLGERFNK